MPDDPTPAPRADSPKAEPMPDEPLDRATVKAYLALIERTARGGGPHAHEAHELLDDLCHRDVEIEPRLRQIERDAQTPLERFLHTMVRMGLRLESGR